MAPIYNIDGLSEIRRVPAPVAQYRGSELRIARPMNQAFGPSSEKINYPSKQKQMKRMSIYIRIS